MTTKKLNFCTDYLEGAHPAIIQRLTETNLEQTIGYGEDHHSANAKRLILEACGLPEGECYLLVGGTQTNTTVIDALLWKHEGVIAPTTGHINVHESGAIEATGHKILTLPEHEGKLCPKEVKQFITDFYADETYEHMVAPGMVYISHPTEYGTLYTLDELKELHQICQEAHIPLFMDGARLGYGLVSEGTDVKLTDVAQLCDVFYIGGTKVGALFGEAVVANRKGLLKHFTPLIKQHGGLLAKGRMLGIQFETLFTDGLYTEIGKHAIRLAMKLKAAFLEKGYQLHIDSPTNQQFVRLPNDVVDRLAKDVMFEYWGPRGEKESIVRFVISWATLEENVDKLIDLL